MTEYEDWTGRRSQRQERISETQIAHFKATFGAALADEAVPLGFQWTLVADLSGREDLGRDGHPRQGIYVPKLPLPRRMWAGGELAFSGRFQPGDEVVRDSLVEKVAFKSGASGDLAFVTMRHDWKVSGETRLNERLDIVYREDPKPGVTIQPPVCEDWHTIRTEPFETDSVLLFRYSALTFNGHRIHYDHPYATTVEGYGGLVVHGPMQALLMLNLAVRITGHLPAKFGYRGLAPLICGTPAVIEAREAADGLELRVRTADGVATMSATATGQAAC